MIRKVLTARTVVILPLCLVVSLLFVSSLQASVYPSGNKLGNPDFESGSFFPWFRDGNAQRIGVEACCAQHDAFWWPNAHYNNDFCPGQLCGNADDRWDGYVWNENQSALQYGALAQSRTINAGQRYRLSAWLATSHGNTARLRWYANGVTNNCLTTTVIWPGYARLSCEFTPLNTSGFNVHMSGNVTKTQWIVSDDWALTQLEQVPQLPPPPQGISKRTVFPVTYFARNYQNTVDRAASNWNNAVPRNPPVFQKVDSEGLAQVIVYAADRGDNLTPGFTYESGGKVYIELNIFYLSHPSGKWTSDPKTSVTGHELGHTLALGHVFSSCQLMEATPSAYWYCGIVGPTTGTKAPVTGDANSLKAIYGWP